MLRPRNASIVTFSDVVRMDGRVKAQTIYSVLKGLGRWYLKRPTTLCENTNVFFYQNKVGIVGRGVITGCDVLDGTDYQILRSLKLHGFSVRISVARWITLMRPIPLAPLVPKLMFIRNKSNWGTSLRRSPTFITGEDDQFLESLVLKTAVETANSGR